jgi:hypothetical protein
MTAAVQPEKKSPSRRALLTGALGGLGALAASAIGRASPARAANGETVLVGGAYSATGITSIDTIDQTAFFGLSANTNALAIFGNAYASTGQATGVAGTSNASAGRGVFGMNNRPSGVGVYATNSTGLALKAVGRTKLSTSGVTTITAGHASKVITPGVNVTSSSFVLLTPKANIGSRALWFTTDASGNKFTIHMSSSRSSGTLVAWLLLG